LSQPSASPWTNPAVVDRLAVLWLSHSATQICGALWDEFNVRVTRNAVVGRLHRMKLTVENKIYLHPLTRSNGHRTPRAPRAKVDQRRIVATICAGPISLRVVDTSPLNLTLMDLDPDSCRYIVTDDTPFLFCGAAIEPDRPYCSLHCGIAYVPPKKREGLPARLPTNMSGHSSIRGRTFAA
jgi:hypothetical protein